ncbi:aminotransferase family protein-like protein [Xylaria bambusicola]|uniref:aminotransferase family protein-like protein n=1 Tax=Xylaria bambusicola TaxID=326684 RepID=UPI0020073685|nr:aminotransferase family protein-like protein [Xylaria bambusicola]KAI0520753.1 aminotransferase family protein-like protein [Xylaria bambusicola]
MTSPLPSEPPSLVNPAVPFGRAMREAYFGFSPDYTPINHGSYGTYPIPVRDALTTLRAEVEKAPDRFIVLEWPTRLQESRAAIAKMLNCETDDLVFVPNATTGSDTVFKNLKWEPGDVILVYEFVYDAMRAGLAWLEETWDVRVEVVPLKIPLTDAEIVDAVVGAAKRVNRNENLESGKVRERVRMAIVDTIASLPGVRIPFEDLVPALQAEGALVLVDGAHGIGHVDIDLASLNPDFLVTSLNKWLFVPRGVSALYVPKRNQALIRTSLPTSHRFRRHAGEPGEPTNAFVDLFDFVATLDMTNFLMVKEALAFRTQVCGGEAALRQYCQSIVRKGAEAALSIFGTEIMDSPDSRIRECNFANVRLPLDMAAEGEEINGENGKIPLSHAARVIQWFRETGVRESGCYTQLYVYYGAMWWRMSGMIYVDEEDFRKAAGMLKRLCERAARGEYLEA